jgi:flagellin
MADFTRIATNIAALQSLNSLQNINDRLGVAQLRLSTGRRINSAADDAAGLTIATKFNFKAQGLGQVLSNIADAKSLITVAEGHLNNISDILTKMKTKATQAANDTLGEDERTAISNELRQLNIQIDNEVRQAMWAGTNLLVGSNSTFASSSTVGYFNFQVGVGTTTADRMTFQIANQVFGTTGTAMRMAFNSRDLRVQIGSGTGEWSVASQASANQFMTQVDAASLKVSQGLSYIGAIVNRLDYQETSLSVAKVNTVASWNRIMNADMAFEQLEATKYQILQQTAITMLAQANMGPQAILGLFR